MSQFSTGMRALALVCAVLGFSRNGRAGDLCEEHLLPTSELVSYIQTLFEEQILSFEQLQDMRESLESGNLVNPLPQPRRASELVHAQALQRILNEPGVDCTHLLSQIDNILERAAIHTQLRHEVEEATINPFQLKFVRIQGGTYSRRAAFIGNPVHEIAVADFEVSATLVTQAEWIRLMPTNPSVHKTGLNSLHPVDNVRFKDVAEFANRLSADAGLPLAYPADGTQRSTEAMEGYRLLTIDEYNYLLSQALPARVKSSDLLNHLWIRESAGGTSHEVGSTKQSFAIDGHEIHDLLGNLGTWLHVSPASILVGYASFNFSTPLNTDETFRAQDFMVSHYSQIAPGTRQDTLGFRLARTLRSPSGATP